MAMDWLSCQNAVLGCVLIKPELCGRLVAEAKQACFDGAQRVIYTAMRELFDNGQMPDAVQVNAKTRGEYHDFIYQLIEITPTSANFERYLDLLKQEAKMSHIRATLTEAVAAEDLAGMEAKIAEANELFATDTDRAETSIGDLIVDLFDRKQKKETYLETGIPALDNVLRTKTGHFNVIAAAPGTGKTALALQIALHMAKTMRVGYYTFEGSKEDLADRIMAYRSRVGLKKLTHPEEITEDDWYVMGKASLRMSKYQLDVIESSGWDVTRIAHHAQSKRYDVIFVDYLQLVAEPGRDRFSIVTEVSIKLRQMANRNKITVYAMSQVSRLDKNRKSQELYMSDLRESGQIEQDADAILLMYLADRDEPMGNRILKIGKNRHGIAGHKMAMEWHGDQQRFTYIPQNQWQDMPAADTKNLPPRTCVQKGAGDKDLKIQATTAEEIRELEAVFEQMRIEKGE